MRGVLGFTLVGAHTALKHALGLAQFRRFSLKKEHRNKDLLKRIVVFAGRPVYQYRRYFSDFGAMLSQAGRGHDIVNYGTQQGEKSDVAYLFSHRLYKSEILPLVGEGDRKRRRDDNDDMHGDGRK